MAENDRLPIPDPTVATNEALARGLTAERDYVDGQVAVLVERLDAIDKATRLLNETVNRVPTDVQQQVGHLRELVDEQFKSVALQFAERDTRSERESRDNKVAVDAAFAAQKEAAAEQNKSNTLAIDKSEKGTAETIKALSEKVDDLKERISAAENRNVGGVEARGESRDQRSMSATIVGAVIGGIGVLIAAVAVVASNL